MAGHRCKTAASLTALILVLLLVLNACAPEEKKTAEKSTDSSGLFSQHSLSQSVSSFDTYTNSPQALKNLFTSLSIPPLDKTSEWKGSDNEKKLLLEARFEGIPLKMLIEMMQSLQAQNWHLASNQAIKGQDTLTISYDLQTSTLKFEFRRDKEKKTWPDVLPPLLAFATPVFSSGTFLSSET